MKWSVYILQCSDDSLYTGITTDLNRRIAEHNDRSSNLGAKFTRGRQPVKLVYQEQLETRSLATKREMEIKSLTRIKKLSLINPVN
ncbi:MAG: GIY-YIG nuclease family protein [Gammaproteobacteria bacterium]|nr:GIY-YIG nuclease family protein [Gammaproteobacteria bacterium]